MAYIINLAGQTGAMAATVRPGNAERVLSRVEILIVPTPTTSEDLVISIVRSGGATTESARRDPSEGTETNYSYVYIPEEADKPTLRPADYIALAFTNTDGGTWSYSVSFEEP
jgi:hypothetical protein